MIYLAVNGTQEGPFPEAEVRRRVEAGELPAEALYWQQGMAEWRPLAELLGEGSALPSVPPPPPPAPVAPRPAWREPYRNVRSPSGWIPLAMWATAVGMLVTAVFFFGMVVSSMGQDEPNGTLLACAFGALGITLLAGLAVMIFYLVWLYRALTNLRHFGAQGLNFSPLLTLVCYFLPVVSLIVPFLALRELSKASQNPSDWQQQKASSAITVWWVATLLPFFSLPISFLMELVESNTPLAVSLFLLMGCGCLLSFIVPFVCMVYVPRQITRQQEALRAAETA